MAPARPPPIIGGGFVVSFPTKETVQYLDEIRTLLTSAGSSDEPTLARIEDALTTGYARALELEADRLRMERRLGELAAEVAERGTEQATEEMGQLARRMSTADRELHRLRDLLESLRARAAEVRVAAAVQ
jgi:hypothetical protein